MRKSEAIRIIQEIINDLGEMTEVGMLQGDFDPGEALLDKLLENGFPIPCNKKGKFDWDSELG